MEELFRKYCIYYATNKPKKELAKLNEEAKKEAPLYQKRAKKIIKKLKSQASILGYDIDFDSFCRLFEEFIAKKSDFEDDEKRTYLKILFGLSKIYDVNLREELEKYVSYKKVSPSQLTERDVFISFCLYNLNPNTDIVEFNRLLNVCEINHLDYNTIENNSKIFVTEITSLSEKLSFAIDKSSIKPIVKKYLKNKKKMSDIEKTEYLKLLLYLCELYNLNAHELLTNRDTIKETSLYYIDPLDNKKLLLELIKERFEQGSFHIEDFNYDTCQVYEEDYNYVSELSFLVYNVYQIFIDKYTNFATDDLNSEYTMLLNDDSIHYLISLEPHDIEKIITSLTNHESEKDICEKYNLDANLYQFIYKSILETMDIKNNKVGFHSLFNTSASNNNIAIYLNGSDSSIIELLKKYIIKCIEQNMNYELDGLTYDNKTYRTIIYSNKKDFKNKINIIEEVISTNSNISSYLMTPLPFSCHNKLQLYSMSRRYIYRNDQTLPYIEITNSILELAYYRAIAKIVISKIKDEKTKDTISNFIDINNYECLDNNPLNSTFNTISFMQIKDIINKYIPLVINSITKYISDTNHQDSLITEFTKAILYLYNTFEGKERHELRNITISN